MVVAERQELVAEQVAFGELALGAAADGDQRVFPRHLLQLRRQARRRVRGEDRGQGAGNRRRRQAERGGALHELAAGEVTGGEVSAKRSDRDVDPIGGVCSLRALLALRHVDHAVRAPSSAWLRRHVRPDWAPAR
ncbi:MAG: hypothetical protein AVDCRST_MAG73-2093 [uncultured Thermomicrobiales bacterium]|uniref:Uncharacterized protein n=1 Tax=uncultured Thermomicrobiales bacterium TaxID=1645740 RepID=A0A6J4U9W6_9BACT|nr:MAG: hypothetical protein AVDCRST_MAG73-2093 [uncultured Thermomicrobiales bacterium]